MQSFFLFLFVRVIASGRAAPGTTASEAEKQVTHTPEIQQLLGIACTNFELSTTYNTNDNVPSATLTVSSAPTPTKIPWAVAEEANGDVALPVTPEGKQYLQGVSTRLEPPVSLSTGGGPLKFDLPFSLSLGTVTAGGVSVVLDSVPAAVAVAFLAWLMASDGMANDEDAVKVASSGIHSATSTSKSTSESVVPTTTMDDALDSVYTAADSVYSSIQQAVLSQISSDGSYDQSFWSSTPTSTSLLQPSCNTALVNMETSTFNELWSSFCKKIDLGKQTDKELTTADVNSNTFPGYKFDLGWEPRQGNKCQNVNCKGIFNSFAGSCEYDSHTTKTSGSMALDCGSVSFSIKAPPTPTSTSTSAPCNPPTITVRPQQCIPPPGNLPRWKDVHASFVNEAASELANQLGNPAQNRMNSQSANRTQVLRHSGASGSGVTYMMEIGWIDGCTIAMSQQAGNPIPGNTNPFYQYQELMKSCYYNCLGNSGMDGRLNVGCLRYGFYPNNANTFGNPPHPQNYLDTMSYCGS